MKKNIGFISTRFAGTDGVSLESNKWAEVFNQNGHNCFWFAGQIDRCDGSEFIVPEAFFKHEKNSEISNQIFGCNCRSPRVTRSIHELRSYLKSQIHEFIKKFDLDLLIAQNVLTIPLHVSLGLALTEAIAETQIPTIAHHHDFYWERIRFSTNAVNDYISMAFPPKLPNVEHVVINSEAREQLAWRTGVNSIIVPNVLDFDNPPQISRTNEQEFREFIGLDMDDIIVLQPTRIIQRKGIEHAIHLVKELDQSNVKLVISHEAGDEGYEYEEWLKDYALRQNVDLRVISTQIGDPWQADGADKPKYSLWDIYPFADYITYPSLYEGFGNAFLEAVYFKKPILVNRYATFVRDIEPLGFKLNVMDGFLTQKTITEIRELLSSRAKKDEMVEHNYQVATKHYSYGVLRQQVNGILMGFFGDTVQQLSN